MKLPALLHASDAATSGPAQAVNGFTTRLTPGRVRRWSVPVASLTAAAVAGTALVIHDPHTAGSWGSCPFYALTGWYCPGCGSLRALHDIAVGRISEAVGHNLLVVPALVWLGWWWLAQVAAASDRQVIAPPSSARFCKVLLAVLAAFVVLRNLPGSPLAP